MYLQNNPPILHQNRSLSFNEIHPKLHNQFIKEQLVELKRKRKLPPLIQQESDDLMDEINKITNIYKIPHIKNHSAIPKIIQLQNQQQNSDSKLKQSHIISTRKQFQVCKYIKSKQPIIKINNLKI